jgi:predicted regulator of Ras-like GTPase activity (Roadblock/LC7/MglB family)
MERSRILKTTGIVLVAVGVAATVGTLIVRDQLERHQRGLFSPRALRRFAALSHIAGANASVELVQLLRDFVAWEPRPLLRRIRGMSDGIGFLGQQEHQRLDDLLVAYLREASVRTAMLLDRAGRLITQAGEQAAFDVTTFASLAAADFAAGDQLAVLLGEREFASLYHHGEQQSMYLADIGGHAILAALFDSRTTLGLVRVMSRKYVPQLGSVFEDAAARGVPGGHVQMDAEWVEEVESEIDRLFSE